MADLLLAERRRYIADLEVATYPTLDFGRPKSTMERTPSSRREASSGSTTPLIRVIARTSWTRNCWRSLQRTRSQTGTRRP